MTDDNKVHNFPGSNARQVPPDAQVPPGRLELVTTYLQMLSPPSDLVLPQRAEALSITRAHRPTLSFYLYLYDTVGADWMWFERHCLADKELLKVLHHPEVSLYVLYSSGVPAGFIELDARRNGEVEIAYFGLMPEFIGRGLGRYLLAWGVGKAFESNPERLWLHTCNFDHPEALVVYQRAGFVAYRQERTVIEDPRPHESE